MNKSYKIQRLHRKFGIVKGGFYCAIGGSFSKWRKQRGLEQEKEGGGEELSNCLHNVKVAQ